MELGIPKERGLQAGFAEKRVGISPAGIEELTSAGARVFVERGAGREAGFSDEEYASAGAEVVYSADEVYGRSRVIVKVGQPQPEVWDCLQEKQLLMGFLHLAVSPGNLLKILLDKQISAVGYEIVRDNSGGLPLLTPMSQIAGRMAVQTAGRLLENEVEGRRGILLGGIPGVPPADVVILGGGALGTSAARAFLGAGARVHIMDIDRARLEALDREFAGTAVTVSYNKRNLRKLMSFADILLCAVLIPGERSPRLVTKAMVKSMRPGSVIMDFAIDQGGCVETSRPTPGPDEVYTTEGVIHFAVPNLPSRVARTATHALTNSLMSYLRPHAEKPWEEVLKASPSLQEGLYTYRGQVVHKSLGGPGRDGISM
jgi:alanine dehydrogenase